MANDVMRRGQHGVSNSVSQDAEESLADATFDSHTLADDLCTVRDIYARFFAALDTTRWDALVGGSRGSGPRPGRARPQRIPSTRAPAIFDASNASCVTFALVRSS